MDDLEFAKEIFQNERASFVLVKAGRVLATGNREGIAELLDAVETLGIETRGASLADKVVGKAVAMVAAHVGIRAIYSPLASEAGQQVLAQARIALQADHIVPLILNRRNDGICPLERLTQPLDQPHQAVLALREFTRLQMRTA